MQLDFVIGKMCFYVSQEVKVINTCCIRKFLNICTFLLHVYFDGSHYEVSLTAAVVLPDLTNAYQSSIVGLYIIHLPLPLVSKTVGGAYIIARIKFMIHTTTAMTFCKLRDLIFNCIMSNLLYK